MTYVVLSVAVLALIAAATFPTVRRLPGRPLLLCALALIALTAVFDNVIVGLDIVGYDDQLISGVRLWHAPIEDFAYAIGAALLVPAIWTWLGKSALAPAATSTATSTPERSESRGTE